MDLARADVELRVREIGDIADPVLPDYLDLYETAFPEAERLPVSSFLRVLTGGARCERTARLLVGSGPDGRMACMARLDFPPGLPAAYLIYLAVRPDVRGSGFGGAMLRWILEMVRREAPDRSFVLLEVEDPTQLSGADREVAERRVAFYRRHGAVTLHGIRYLQRGPLSTVEVPMLLTLFRLEPVAPETVLASAYELYGSAVTRLPEPLELR